MKIRLDKFISSQLNLTRSDAKKSIKKGLVEINNTIITDSGFLLESDVDSVFYNGQAVTYKRYRYIIMNKPKGILSASNDKRRKTVVDLVPNELSRPNLFPVGRLDKDTTGLLIITDDGDFAHKVISPKSMIEKAYIAELDGDINEEIIDAFSKGIVLHDGTSCAPAKLFRLEKNRARVVITEGKYHQIKRMFGTVNLGVNSLHRESIGRLKIPEGLNFGECVEISFTELESLCL